MVVVPFPWPAGTGFGDAVIGAPDAAGLPDGAVASGAFDGLHPAKKSSGKRTAVVQVNRFIKIVYLFSFSNAYLASNRIVDL